METPSKIYLQVVPNTTSTSTTSFKFEPPGQPWCYSLEQFLLSSIRMKVTPTSILTQLWPKMILVSKLNFLQVGEMVRQLRVSAPSLAPTWWISTTYDYMVLEYLMRLFWALQESSIHMLRIHTCKQKHSYTYNKQNFKLAQPSNVVLFVVI